MPAMPPQKPLAMKAPASSRLTRQAGGTRRIRKLADGIEPQAESACTARWPPQ